MVLYFKLIRNILNNPKKNINSFIKQQFYDTSLEEREVLKLINENDINLVLNKNIKTIRNVIYMYLIHYAYYNEGKRIYIISDNINNSKVVLNNIMYYLSISKDLSNSFKANYKSIVFNNDSHISLINIQNTRGLRADMIYFDNLNNITQKYYSDFFNVYNSLSFDNTKAILMSEGDFNSKLNSMKNFNLIEC